MAFTKMRTPYDNETEYFGNQLSRLSRMLDLAPPTFHGRVIPCEVPEIIRWEIECNAPTFVTLFKQSLGNAKK
jgi:hypothetical protein